jgi:multiple sugar transport system substrate-binding protein
MLKKLSRRKFLQLSGASTMAIVLAACAPGAAPQTGTGAEAGPSIATTEITHWGRNSTEEEVVWKPLVELAKDMFPELTITLQSPPEQMVEKLLIAFAGGTAPDTAVGGLSSFGGWIGIDMINSIQPFIDADAEVQSWLPEYVPAALQGYSYQGDLYGVPTVNEGIMLWYHKDAILEAGLTPPAEIEDDPNRWNWNTVTEYALALNQGEGFRRDRYGIIATSNKGINGWSESWGNLVYARGGRFLDEAGEEFQLDSQETAEALQWVVDLTHSHDVQPNTGDMGAAEVLDRAMFQNGQVGMVVQGEYFRRYLWGTGKPSEPIPFAYDMALMPFNPVTNLRTNIYHGNGTFMTTQAEAPSEAWKWLKVVFTQEAQQVITDKWGSRGAHRGTYESFMASNAGGGPDGLNYGAFNKVDSGTAAYPTTPYLTKEAMLEPMWRIVYDNIFPGIVPVEEGLAQIRTETVTLLDRGREEYNARRS